MANYVKGKRTLITGAASGFGRLLCAELTNSGAHVLGVDIDADGLGSLADELGGELLTRRTDVTDAADFAAAANVLYKAHGGVDVLVNNAGTMPLAFHADHKDALAAWNRCIDVNIRGVMNGIAAVHDLMIEQGQGHIVNLSSIYGNFPVVGAGVYGASKAAVNFLSESLRVESQGKIRVTLVKPTGVPGTNLGTGIINPEALIGILGQNGPEYMAKLQARAASTAPAAAADPESSQYAALDPEIIVAAIVHAIDQPQGVAVGDITVRATGDGYIL